MKDDELVGDMHSINRNQFNFNEFVWLDQRCNANGGAAGFYWIFLGAEVLRVSIKPALKIKFVVLKHVRGNVHP